MEKKPLIVVVCGATASGKTKLGIEIAQKINGEIISADSMQIYKDMDIGSAKPSLEEMKLIKHHLIDFLEPDKRYSVADFKKDAEKKIKEILLKGKVPVIVGGTGLYINSLIYNINYNEEKVDLKYREELNKTSLDILYDKALEIDKQATEKISPNDRKRIQRILEIYHNTNKNKTQLEKESRKEIEYDYRIYGINMDRNLLYERINLRVDQMIEKGLIQEVKNLVNKYKDFPTAMQGLGYKEVLEYLENKITKEDMIEKIKQETRRYAKRQLTWFRRNKDIKWLDYSCVDNSHIIMEDICEKTEEK